MSVRSAAARSGGPAPGRRAALALLAVLASLALTACVNPTKPETPPEPIIARVNGVAMYLQRIGLPPGTRVVAQILEASASEAAKPVIGEKVLDNVRQLPVRFDIDFDFRKVSPERTYVVQVIVENGGRLLFVNRGLYPVLTRGFSNDVEVLLDDAPQ
jgi:putative lipoprotein